MTTSPYDSIDHVILYHLQEDGHKTFTEIATALDVADNTVRNRVKKLEEEDVIKGFQAKVDYDRAGVQHYYLFSCTARVSEREELAEDARQYDGVLEVITLMTGRENVLIIGAGTEKDDITDLASDLDELGLVVERENLIREHVRQPFQEFALENDL